MYKRYFLITQILICCLFACKQKSSNMVSILNTDKDTVSRELKKLPDSALTRISIEPIIYMYDTIKRGEVLAGKFKIKNVGLKPFELAQAISFCGCATVNAKDLIVNSKDSTHLSFVLDTEGFDKGYFERAITILGNFKPYYRTLKIEGYIE